MKYWVILLCIVLLAGFLRFWQLGVNPPSLSWDEVAWGYNAYSIGTSGKDEFGRFLPLDYLESYGDYKPPVYVYLDVVPVKLFGLTAFATRFPSALLGTLAVVISYFLTKRIFFTSKRKQWYALAAAGILAISPWSIMLSRAAFEANVASFFVMTGMLLFLIGVQDKKWYSWIGASVVFSLSMATFNSARVVTPLLCLVLIIVFWKKLWEQKKIVFLSLAVGLVVLLPTIRFLLSPQAKLRYNEVNIFSDVSLVKNANQQIANDRSVWWSKILHNRRLVYSVAYLQHYLDNLSPSFLFIQGDGNPKFSTRDVGEMYLWDLPFFIIGIFLLFRKKEGYWWIIPLWLLLSIVPAAVARETPHALRIENSLPTFQILSAYGFVSCLFMLTKYRKVFVGLSLALLAGFLIYFQHGYYAHYPREFSSDWQYGYKEALAFARANEFRYQHIQVTSALGRPYMYVLFFDKIPSLEFRTTSTIQRDAFGFVHVENIGKYEFPDALTQGGKTLYIDVPSHMPQGARVLQTFPMLNGDTSLVAYTL